MKYSFQSLSFQFEQHDSGKKLKKYYKYMSAETALKVLSSGRIRWGAPSTFNDPFDVPKSLVLDFTQKELGLAMKERIKSLILNPPDDLTGLEPILQSVLEYARDADNLVREKMTDEFKTLPDDYGSLASLSSIQDKWESIYPNLRILCVSTRNDSTAMWYHYADRYEGVALELVCFDAESAWNRARQVEYKADNPYFREPEAWAKIASLDSIAGSEKLMSWCVFHKSSDWEYEDEYRIVTHARPHEQSTYTDFGFGETDIGNLYLGANISEELAEKLVQYQGVYPRMGVYESSFGLNRKIEFSLLCEPI